MAVLHRALFTWFNLLIFLILLVLRLDLRIQWNWFIVFIPMWLYDNILLIYIIFNMISHCKNGLDRASSLKRKVIRSNRNSGYDKRNFLPFFFLPVSSLIIFQSFFFQAWYMIAVLTKLSGQVLVCLKLEAAHWNLPATAVLAPLWLLLPALACDVFVHLIQTSRY